MSSTHILSPGYQHLTISQFIARFTARETVALSFFLAVSSLNIIEPGLPCFLVGRYLRQKSLLSLYAKRLRTTEAALSRLNAQFPLATKIKFADHVIDSSGDMHDLEMQVNALVQRFCRESGWTWKLFWGLPPLGILMVLWALLWRAIKESRKRSRRGRRKEGGIELKSTDSLDS